MIAMGKICYLIVPEGLSSEVEAWAESTEARFGWRVEVLHGFDWNNDMTPWEAPGVFRAKKPFGGQAETFLPRLEASILEKEAAAGLSLRPCDRAVAGISLSGLFAMWAAHRSNLFGSVVSISGSFWYEGFADWVEQNSLSPSVERVYISLGAREAGAKDPLMATVQTQTERIVAHLKSQMSDQSSVVYSLEPGITHFSPIIPRLETALKGTF